MKRTIELLMLLLFLDAITPVSSAEPNPDPVNRVLIIERCVTPVSAGKATLSISPLRRTGDVYAGDYHMNVSPYFFKSEKGRLAIVVSDESMARVTKGLPADITGTATSSGDGEKRRIDAVATPADPQRGTLKLWFFAGDRKMVFTTSYRITEP